MKINIHLSILALDILSKRDERLTLSINGLNLNTNILLQLKNICEYVFLEPI